jgi:hypothetical protein
VPASLCDDIAARAATNQKQDERTQ